MKHLQSILEVKSLFIPVSSSFLERQKDKYAILHQLDNEGNIKFTYLGIGNGFYHSYPSGNVMLSRIEEKDGLVTNIEDNEVLNKIIQTDVDKLFNAKAKKLGFTIAYRKITDGLYGSYNNAFNFSFRTGQYTVFIGISWTGEKTNVSILRDTMKSSPSGTGHLSGNSSSPRFFSNEEQADIIKEFNKAALIIAKKLKDR